MKNFKLTLDFCFRTGKRSTMGLVRDGYNSAARYVLNNFYDGFRQVKVDSLNSKEKSCFPFSRRTESMFSSETIKFRRTKVDNRNRVRSIKIEKFKIIFYRCSFFFHSQFSLFLCFERRVSARNLFRFFYGRWFLSLLERFSFLEAKNTSTFRNFPIKLKSTDHRNLFFHRFSSKIVEK